MALLGLHEAELAVLTGESGAADMVAQAEAACDECGLRLHRDGARVLLGHVVGGDRGAEMRRDPLERLGDAGVQSPEAYLSVFVPTLRRFRRLVDA
jgi:hypothetical protein